MLDVRRSWLLAECIFLLAMFAGHGSAMADKGVFNAKVTPNEALAGEGTVVSITAEIGAENFYINSVTAYRTTADGQPIAPLGRMFDDGTNGDEQESDTVFTRQVTVNEASGGKLHYRVTAAYRGDRNRYMSPVMELNVWVPVPPEVVDDAVEAVQSLEQSFESYLSTMDVETARQQALADAVADPNISAAALIGPYLSILYEDQVAGISSLTDPADWIDAAGKSLPSALPEDYSSPRNDKLLIFAPSYSDSPYPLKGIADHAENRFAFGEYMTFAPVITKDHNASLEVVKTFGNYGTIVIQTHGYAYCDKTVDPKCEQTDVVLNSGTLIDKNDHTYDLDKGAKRIGVLAANRYFFRPSFVTQHASKMENTFFYLGACYSLYNETMWNALKAKGAKVAFGWNQVVCTSFDVTTFEKLINPMLPESNATDPKSARDAFDAILPKTDDTNNANCNSTPFKATVEMRTASAEWNKFVFFEGGIVNGDFETGDWTGWTHGGVYDYRIIAGARKHSGASSAALGRWDTAYQGEDPTLEPFGYEWFYQDFVVPANVTYLKFYWWMETYDTANWDWFDAYLQDTNGNLRETILSQAGKPGLDFGPYWTTQIEDGGSGWREVKVNVSEYRGQTVRLYFDQRLDGYGDQQRVYVDDVSLE